MIVPKGKSLRPVQENSLGRLLNTKGNVFLCDKPGDGKTVTTICYMNAKKIKRALIVCKTSGVEVWRRHLDEWHLGKPVVYEYKPQEPVFMADIVIVNYHWLSYKQCAAELINHFRYDLCVLDEPHIIRTANSTRAKNLFVKNGICSKAKRTIAITGTLLFNKPIGLYPLLRGLTPRAIWGYDKHRYGMQFCGGRFDGQQEQYVYDGATNIPVLRRMLDDYIIESGEDTPDDNLAPPEVVYLYQDGKVSELLKTFDETFKPEKFKRAKEDEDVEVATLRRELGESKIDQSIGLLKLEILKYSKVLIFAYHREVVKELHRRLIYFCEGEYLIGGMPKKKARESIDLFQLADGPRFLVASVTAFNDTITLTATRRPVFVEISYIWNENYQAIMRTRPMLQDKQVRPLFIMYKGSFDERMLEINFNNKKVQKEFNK